MKKPDYALDAPMNVSNPHTRALPFQHNGAHHVLPTGVSTWPFEIAERLERKFEWAGVRITFTRPVALKVVAEVADVIPGAEPVAVAESAPAVVAEPPLDSPASPDVETPAEPVRRPSRRKKK